MDAEGDPCMVALRGGIVVGDVVLVPEWRVCAWELGMSDPVVNTLPKFTPSLTLSGLTLCGAEC